MATSTLQFWLSIDNNRERIRLPVNPESIKVNSGYNWTDVNITQFGDYSIPGGHPLTEISFSSFFPRDYNDSYCEYQGFKPPSEFIAQIGNWKESRTPIRLIVTGFGGGKGINYPMTIRNLTLEERAGSPGDVYYTLELKEFRFVELTKVGAAPSKQTGLNTTIKATPKPPRPNMRDIPKTYIVKPNDNLTKIVQRLRTLGKKDLTVAELYAANKKTIGKDRNLILPGQVLIIP